MKRVNLTTASTDELVRHFAMVGVQLDEQLLREDLPKINALVKRGWAIRDELKKWPGDARRELLALFDHPNMQVQLNAAKATLASAPDAARAKLEEIRATKWRPQAGDASHCLWNLSRGFFKPT